MLSWTSPLLQGSPAVGHHHFLSPPLTAEDISHCLLHRDFWMVFSSGEPFSLAGFDPRSLASGRITAGPGWFSLTRRAPARGLEATAVLWCPSDLPEPVELMRVTVTNTGAAPVSFMPYAAVPLYARSADNVRDHRHVTVLLHRLEMLKHGLQVKPAMSFDERGHRLNAMRYAVLGFGPKGAPPAAIWSVEEDFLGNGTFAAPQAVWKREAAPRRPFKPDPGLEAIGAFRFKPCSLAPGRSADFLIVSGATEQNKRIDRWARVFSRPAVADRSLEKTKRYWLTDVRPVAFVSDDRNLDSWLTWVSIQPMLRRLYGNSYLPQFDYGRGGRGWRDLWQDCLALLLSDPASVRGMLLHNFGGIRIDGSNATIIGKDGGFIADRNSIPRTWMDHGAWPTLTTLLYVDQTGDTRFLLEEREYFRDPQIFRCREQDKKWTPAYGNQLRARSGRVCRGPLLEHMIVQHVTAFFNVGEHNHCLLEGADWNDGLDMAAKRGESVAFSSFYAWNFGRLAHWLDRLREGGMDSILLAEELFILLDRLPGARRIAYASPSAKRGALRRYLAKVAKDISGKQRSVKLDALAKDLRAKADAIAAPIRRHEWLTEGKRGFFNGYYDNRGRRVESMRSGRLRMMLTGQVFPIMSGIATEPQVEAVIRSVNAHLRDPGTGGIRLNTDFGSIQPDLGRAFSFAYGEKENGAVFSHMAVMYAYALYLRRRPHDGRRVWQALYRMANDSSAARIFPCLPEYFNADNRGMYSYLTGSASWLIYLVLTQVCGLRGEEGNWVVDPQLTRDDFGKQGSLMVHFRFAGRSLEVRIENPSNLEAGKYRVKSIRSRGRALSFTERPKGGVAVARSAISALPKAGTHLITIVLGV